MTSATLPPVTRDFQLLFRALGLEIGWKNAAKELAYGPTAPSAEQIQARQERRDERQMAEEYLAVENPVLDYCDYRQVSRFRQPRSNYGALSERPRPVMVEQVTVSEQLALQLRERGVKVNHNRRTGAWWADVEDEVWGADDWMTECFGDRYGEHPYTFDNALDLLRAAHDARQCVRGR